MQRFKNSYQRFLYVRAASNARIGHLTDNGIEKRSTDRSSKEGRTHAALEY
jgi:hypothetical protein